jgi:hypothetical protein
VAIMRLPNPRPRPCSSNGASRPIKKQRHVK